VNVISSARYSLSQHQFSIGANYKFYGPRTGFIVDRAGTIEETTIEGAHLLDMSISKSFIKELLRIDAGAKNLLGIKNTTSIGTQSGEAHSTDLFFWGRTFYVKVKINLTNDLRKKS